MALGPWLLLTLVTLLDGAVTVDTDGMDVGGVFGCKLEATLEIIVVAIIWTYSGCCTCVSQKCFWVWTWSHIWSITSLVGWRGYFWCGSAKRFWMGDCSYICCTIWRFTWYDDLWQTFWFWTLNCTWSKTCCLGWSGYCWWSLHMVPKNGLNEANTILFVLSHWSTS